MPSRRIAAIDVGTNTAMMVVADKETTGSLHIVREENRFVRLGEGVAKSGEIGPEAVDRLLATLREYQALASEDQCDEILIGATSASRDASNLAAIQGRVRRELGLDYRVISGEEEARLTFLGAISDQALTEPVLAIDIGAGSTEIILGNPDGSIAYEASHQMGAIRMTELFLGELPAGPDRIREAQAYVHFCLSGMPAEGLSGRPLMGISGGMAQYLTELASPEMSRADVQSWASRLASMSAEETRALNPELLTGRAPYFFAGLVILEVVMGVLEVPYLWASARGFRHGLLVKGR